MANLSEDIQYTGSDTRPPMLDRTDFASWQQRIRLYCQGKENGVNILKSIDEGPFQMGTFRDTLAEGNEGALHLALPKDIYSLINHYTDAKDIWDNVKMLLEGSELTKEVHESQLYDDFEHFRQHKGETIHDYYVQFAKLINDMRNIKMEPFQMQLFSKCELVMGELRTELGMLIQFRNSTHVVNVVSKLEDCDAYDYVVVMMDHNAQTMFHANLSCCVLVYDEAGRLMIRNCLYLRLPINDSFSGYDNTVPVVQNNVSSVPNDAYMMILNDMHEPPAQYVSVTTQNNVVAKSLTAELATYKEQVKLYERVPDSREAKDEKMLDISLASAYLYTKHSQELLEYVIGTCPKYFNQRDKKHAYTPLTKKKQVTFEVQCATSNSNIHKHVEKLNTQKTNVHVPPSTGVNSCTDASGSQPRSNTKKNRILLAKSVNKKNVEEHPKTNKSYRSSFGIWTQGYGDYVIGDSVISRVYYVEGLGHNLFFVGQFCDSDLEVAFRKHSCYVRDTNGVELIKGSRGSNLYTISIEDMMKSSPICLLSKASKNKSWLWHRRLNHLNFGTINDLARKDLVRGLPRLKFEKDHFCSACQLGKSKKHTHKPKTKHTNLEVLNTLHMDLCRPMRVQTINGKKYILVIVDDYSRFTWVKFLRSKDETPEVVIKFLKQIQVGLNKTIRYIRTDNDTEFVNKDLTTYYECVGIFHQKTVLRTPQQSGVVKRQNRTLVEAARTMLIFSKAPMVLWAEVVATACYTQNRSLIHTLHNKTPYELVHDKKHDLTFFRVFCALYYRINDNEDLGKLQPTTV
ncbi:retrovirus-related pol polyprotein from transposon TNT 1-94 [Tanacetum coccineum]